MSTQQSGGREPQDLRYVNVEEEWEVQWWAAHFSTTPEQLHRAVQEHGNDAQVIKQRLKEAARKSFTNMGES